MEKTQVFEKLKEMKTKLVELKDISQEIRDNNFTKKTRGTNYPINRGYATAVRRPIEALLRWTSGVEEMLDVLLDEVYK